MTVLKISLKLVTMTKSSEPLISQEENLERYTMLN